jgi:lipopolysaccharide export system permease protein
VFCTLIVLVVAVNLVESVEDLSDAEAGASTALKLAFYSSIQNGYQVMPIACFMGVLVAGTLLSRRGETLAAQAAGVSSFRLAMSFLAVVVVASSCGAACGELLVPRAVAGVERVQREELKRRSALSRFYARRPQWFRQGDLLIHLSSIDRKSETVETPTVYRFVDDRISEVIEAESMRHDQHGWFLQRARVRTARSAEVVELDTLRLPLSVQPADLIDVTGDPRQMTSGEVRRLIERRRQVGFDTAQHQVELHSRIATPLSAIWMFLLVSPWALHPTRRRSMTRTLGAGVVIIALLLSVTQVFRLLALSHKIPVPLGAWGVGLVSLLALPLSLSAYKRYRVRGSLW